MTTSRCLKMDRATGFVDDFFGPIPEGFIAKALSLTSPRDACRLSLVCSVFLSAAKWDEVWERFLPPEYRKIAEEEDGVCSMKQLFLRLCDHPTIIHGGTKSFNLDKNTAKKCYMLAATELSIVWGDTPRYWRWISLPESRFTEVAELISVCWLEVNGRISTAMLSPNTVYIAFMVFKLTFDTHGLDCQPVEVSIGINGLQSHTHTHTHTHTVFLVPEGGGERRRYPDMPRIGIGMVLRGHEPTTSPSPNPSRAVASSNGNLPKQRKDGWMEIELGEYFVKDEEGELVMSMKEVKGRNWKGGLLIQGIEIRPKPFIN